MPGNSHLQEFIASVLEKQPFTFSVEGKTIFIQPEEVLPNISSQLVSQPPITGVVRDAEGKPIAGANVVIKGKNKGTATNADGTFLLKQKKEMCW